MKSIVFLLLAVPFSLWGQVSPTMKKGIEALSNPNSLIGVDCDDPNAPAWCHDLYKSTCELKKSSDKLGTLNAYISGNTYNKMPQNPQRKDLVEAGSKAVKMSDELVYQQGTVLRKDVVNTFMQAKTVMFQAITSSAYLSEGTKKRMVDNISKIKLRTGQEYVDSLVEWAVKQQPSVPKEAHKQAALEIYMSTCGATGLEVNAFYENGNMVICPGLVYSLEDYGPKGKEEVLNALSFTLGHEMGHAIDSMVLPDAYSKMKACYEQTTGKKDIFNAESGAEIAGDFWGALVLGQRLKSQRVTGANAVRAVTLATDGFCLSPKVQESSPHQENSFRVNTIIAKAPAMREVLGCSTASSDNPYCSIEGKIPR